MDDINELLSILTKSNDGQKSVRKGKEPKMSWAPWAQDLIILVYAVRRILKRHSRAKHPAK